MKIGFFFKNKDLEKTNFSAPQKGNPGIGGTWFCFLLLLHYLKHYRREWRLTVYAFKDADFPEGIVVQKISSFRDALSRSLSNGDDFFVMKNEGDFEYFEVIRSLNHKVIFWTHNYIFSRAASLIANEPNIVANVFVGKQQYDRYVDHDIILKSTYIFNMLPPAEKIRIGGITRKKSVVYMGALVPGKGFLELAKIWKSILRKIPDATLEVIGTGGLYSDSVKLGEICMEKEFERQILPYIQDEHGNIHPSITFLGKLGSEKFEVFQKASVGCVNPSKHSETFCLAALEMEACALPVVSIGRTGLYDTVVHLKTGYLGKNLKEIENGIVKLLSDKSLCQRLGTGGVAYVDKFSPNKILPKWIDFFDSLTEKKFYYKGISTPYFTDRKILRVFLRTLRFHLGMKILPPLIFWETLAWRFLRRLRNTEPRERADKEQ